jgi:putative membrane protein insertion efficiency factor
MNRCLSIALFLVLLLLPLAPAARGAEWGPWGSPSSPKGKEIRLKDTADFNLLKTGVRFFRRYISPVDGPRCRMYPTCSAYALEALDKHGPFMGAMMTVDRLLHEGDPREHRHPIQVGGSLRFHDPVENNDFWLTGR